MKRNYNFRACLFMAFWLLGGVCISQTYTFTSATATGNIGPTQAMVNSEYVGTTLDGSVTVTGGIQYWVVPANGIYLIEAFGGQGYGAFGGRGAHISGEFNLTAGTTLKILVGQRAGDYLNFPAATYNNQYGGGGGSFVTYTDDTPLIVAGGGGGNHASSFSTSCDGQITTSGAAGTLGVISAAGGTNGNGGFDASSADGGGGLLSNGGGIAGGQSFILGGAGGIDEGTGGFGCGGGTSSWNNVRGGGGGGYSGGGGANNNGSLCCAAGGGGGSFNGGTNSVNLAGVQTGNGTVIITNQCSPSIGTLAPDIASLQDISEDCVSIPTAPTATNDCVGGIVGTPDIAFPITAVGTTVVTWTYTDGVNTITQTQNVIINGIDGTPPVVNNASLPDLSGQCDLTPPTPLATDACAGTILGVADVTFPLNAQGLTVITWTYDDGNGNTTTQTQNITLNDVAPPNLDNASLPDYNGCGAATPPTPTATDYCMGTINGVPDVTFPITAAGPTTVTWTYDDGNGNTTTQTQDVYSTMMDLSVSLAGTTITANATGVSYAWIDCGTNQEIAGETGQTYTPSVTGQYAVVITNGTCVDTSECTLVDFTGIDEIVSKMFRIYPNPNNGQFIVDIDSEEAYEITIHDIAGKVIYRNASISNEKNEVSLGKLEGGTYYVTIENETSKATRKMVVN
jgi:hypothetical protein